VADLLARARRAARAELRLARRRVRRLRRFVPSGAAARGLAARGLLAFVPLVLGLALWRTRLSSPEPTLLLRDRHDRFLGEVGQEGFAAESGYWPLAEVPPRVAAATLAVEDRRFFRHAGVDPVAVLRALRQNVSAGRRVSGASTIAMQVARLQRPGARTFPRKVLESLTAFLMTVVHGREAVLRHYFRIVPYGNGIRGIGYAARRYLDKPVEDLSWAETAFLAAIPQTPARLNPFRPSGRRAAVRRARRILDLLLERGALSGEEHDLACRQIEDLRVPPVPERKEAALHAVLYLDRQLRAAGRRDALRRRPIVRTTLDLDVQEEVSWMALRAVSAWEGRGAGNAAVVVLDRASREVRAWVGSTDYFDTRHAGAIDYTRVPRSPGSALKPFVYAFALERGVITPATVLDDLERGPGGIGNADEAFLGPMLPRSALGNSRNVPAALLLDRVGLDTGYALFRDLGLHAGEKPARAYGLGLAIGGLPVTLEALVRAYAVLAGDGRLGDIVWYEGQPEAPPRRVFSEDTARQLTLFLADPQARLPGFARMGALEYPFPVAVKTGTSSRFRDAWTVGYSSRYLVGVWVGDPGFRPMNRLTGYRSAAELAQWVLRYLHRDDDPLAAPPFFPPPRGSGAVRLCALTGRLATDACEHVALEWLRPGEGPVDACRAHVRLAVDARTGRPATRATPRASVELRTYVDLPPRYAAWAAAAGLEAPPSARPTLASLVGPPALSRPARVSITAPADGERLLRDPETPAALATLALTAVVDPPVPQVVWLVDGRPWKLVDYPYAARWPLAAGEHVFQALVPALGKSSARVTVTVE
jgi:penicillin-binding protein 1C